MENEKDRYVLPQDKKEELEKELSDLFKRQGLQDRSKGMVRLFGIKVNQYSEQIEKEKPGKEENIETDVPFSPSLFGLLLDTMVAVYSTSFLKSRERIATMRRERNKLKQANKD